MLSESNKSVNRSFGYEFKETLKKLPEPRAIRLKFIKVGNLQFISHLDLQRTFQRVIVRSGVPVWYTQGFNPHAKMVFCMPLPVGVESECEFLDIKIDREMSTDEILTRFNRELTDEMYLTDVYEPTSKFSDVVSADYTVTVKSGSITEHTADEVKRIFQSPVRMIKKGKAGEREIDITEQIFSFDAKSEDGLLEINMNIGAGDNTLNPEMVMTAIRERLNILNGADESYRVLRKALYTDGGKLFR